MLHVRPARLADRGHVEAVARGDELGLALAERIARTVGVTGRERP